MVLMLLFIAMFAIYLRLELPQVFRDNAMLAMFTILTVVVIGATVGGLRDLRVRLTSELEVRRAVEARIREAEQRHRAMLDHAPTIIIMLDRDGRFLFLNRQAAADGRRAERQGHAH